MTLCGADNSNRCNCPCIHTAHHTFEYRLMADGKYATTEVLAFADMPFVGNIIPHSWYQHVRKFNGKVDAHALLLLGDVCYWYRPTVEYDDETNQVVKVERKFHAEHLQRSYKQIQEKYGFTKNQARRALETLEALNLVHREFHTIYAKGVKLANVMYLIPNVERIAKITTVENSR